MGLFCANIHLRTNDAEALSAAVDARGLARCRVAPEKGGWISLYEEQASQQDEDWIRDLAGGLSRDLGAPAIAFMVHDSDIARYWLFENGRLLDEYDSSPGYFEGDGSSAPSGGRPDVLLPYCRPGVQRDDIAAILSEETLFAESIVERLAKALGIDPGRALTDFGDGAGEGPDGPGGWDDADDGDEGGGSVIPHGTGGLASQLGQMLGLGRSGRADPQAAALVQAAADGQTAQIDRLLAEGVPVDAEAPISLPGGQPLAGLGQLLPGGPPKIPMTALLAAVAYKRHAAAERLLEKGADPNRVHPLFGTAVHAAAGAGNAELLQLMLDHGGDVSVRNAQGQSPLEIIAAGRAMRERLAHVQSMTASLGMKLPGLAGQLSNLELPVEGWDACERLLKGRSAR